MNENGRPVYGPERPPVTDPPRPQNPPATNLVVTGRPEAGTNSDSGRTAMRIPYFMGCNNGPQCADLQTFYPVDMTLHLAEVHDYYVVDGGFNKKRPSDVSPEPSADNLKAKDELIQSCLADGAMRM